MDSYIRILFVFSSTMLYVLALHIIFIVTWFAGLFYIVRLFIYHTEANAKPEPERNILLKQFIIMEKRLWYGITWPSAVGACLFGSWLLLVYRFELLYQAYFILKLCFVGGLVLYHLQCHNMFAQLQKNEFKYSSLKLRLWNELATVFLVAIVFIIVLKQNNNYIWIALGTIILAVTLYGGILLYRKNSAPSKKEEKKNDAPPPPPLLPPPLS